MSEWGLHEGVTLFVSCVTLLLTLLLTLLVALLLLLLLSLALDLASMLLPSFLDRCVQGWLEVEGWSGAQVPVETEAPMLHGLQLGLEPGQGRLLLAPLL